MSGTTKDNEQIGWGIYCPLMGAVYFVSVHKQRAIEFMESPDVLQCENQNSHVLVQVRM